MSFDSPSPSLRSIRSIRIQHRMSVLQVKTILVTKILTFCSHQIHFQKSDRPPLPIEPGRQIWVSPENVYKCFIYCYKARTRIVDIYVICKKGREIQDHNGNTSSCSTKLRFWSASFLCWRSSAKHVGFQFSVYQLKGWGGCSCLFAKCWRQLLT